VWDKRLPVLGIENARWKGANAVRPVRERAPDRHGSVRRRGKSAERSLEEHAAEEVSLGPERPEREILRDARTRERTAYRLEPLGKAE